MNRCTVTAVPGEQGISFSRESDAPATRVFRAYTDPTLLRQWTGPQGSELVIRDFVARTGGLYNYRIAGPERELEFFGSFHEVTETLGREYAARIVRTVQAGGRSGHRGLEVLRLTGLVKGRCRLDGVWVFTSSAARAAVATTEPGSCLAESFNRLDGLLASVEGDSGSGLYGETSNHRPGEPLREWDAVTARRYLALTIMGSASEEAIVRLIDGDSLSSEDLIAFG